jgi:acyl dehydratase
VTGLVGTLVDRVELQVERGKIAEFARASRAEDAVHTDPEAARSAGFRGVLATATHVVVAGHQRDQQAFVAALGLDISRVVVGSVAWEHERALVVGDTLVATRHVVADETRDGRSGGSTRLVTLETQYLDADGAVVVRQREVLVERART